MPEYLRQDLIDVRGYAPKPGRPKPGEAAVALTEDGRCVFGDAKMARATYAKTGSKLMYYDDEVERQRRLVCDTALGQLMLDNPKIALPAVNAVSSGIETYWHNLKSKMSGPDAFKDSVETDGRYVSSPTSFGRLPVAKPSPSEVNQFKATIDIWVGNLSGTDLPKIMTLHVAFLKIYSRNEPKAGKPMEIANKLGLWEDWYDKEERGRSNRQGFTGTAMPGLISDDFTIPYALSLERCGIDLTEMRLEVRNRGTDMFMIEATKMGPDFRKMLGEHNLVFAASASGTTSTLLASAATFRSGFLSDAEAVRQYLMACVAYLVGGGMHTCHEVFYTAGRAGLSYTPGKYIAMLPRTFTGSRLYEHWATEFWDIVRPDRPSPR
jgi:hypothetical protein